MKALLTGATGLIGKYLITKLLAEGFEINVLSRRKREKENKIQYFEWDPSKNQIDSKAFDGVTVVINLAGANVGEKRWTKEYKKEILDSRILSTRLLYNTLSTIPHHVSAFIHGSGVGYYGLDTNDSLVDESWPKGHDFLAEVVELWEKEALKIQSLGIRTVILRQAVVLSKSGGALPQLLTPTKFFAGAVLGKGTQYFAWIDIEDLINMYLFSIKNNISGIYNASSPNPVTNKELTYKLAKVINRKVILPSVPAFALKILLGDFAESLLGGNRPSSEKIRKEGFSFQHDLLEKSLKHQLDL